MRIHGHGRCSWRELDGPSAVMLCIMARNPCRAPALGCIEGLNAAKLSHAPNLAKAC